MNPGDTMLEQRITDALNERADATGPRMVRSLDLATPPRRRPSRHTALIAAAVVLVLVIIVAIVRPVTHSDHPTTPATTAPAPSTTLPPRPAGALGDEVPLHVADTSDTQFLINLAHRKVPPATAIAVQAEGAAPIVVSGSCITIARPATNGSGYQGSCATGGDAAHRLVGTLDSGGAPPPGSTSIPGATTYGAWVAVPPGTEYVNFSYGDFHAWQRPVSGISYFTSAGDLVNHRTAPASFQAYSASGQLLGTATP